MPTLPCTEAQGDRSHLGFVAVVLLGLSLLAAGFALKSYRDETRIETEQGQDARILDLQRRRHTLAGTITFERTVGGRPITCRTQALLGEVGDDLHVGDTITIIPRDDSCGEPIIVGPRHPRRLALAALIAFLMAGFCAWLCIRAAAPSQKAKAP